MKKQEFLNFVSRNNWIGKRSIRSIAEKFDSKITRKKGCEEKRDQFAAYINRWNEMHRDYTSYTSHKLRKSIWMERQAQLLAIKAGEYTDEHGYNRGDYHTVDGLDFVLYKDSLEAPYLNSSKDHEGMALIQITRKRIYARNSSWGPSYASTKYLVGQNETGTYYTHPVPKSCKTVLEALEWIWQGRQDQIMQRQGDIALIWGKGPKLPTLPSGHKINKEKGIIEHETHPSLSFPTKGQRIIVGRRAATRVSEATRD